MPRLQPDRVLRFVLIPLLAFACGRADAEAKFVRALPGTLVLAGQGELPSGLMDLVLERAEGPGGRVLVVATDGRPKTLARWRARGARSAAHLDVRKANAQRLALALLDANVVWFEDGAGAAKDRRLLAGLLRGLLRRGGVVGGAGHGALALAARGFDDGKQVKPEGFALLPASVVELVRGPAVRASGSPTRIVAGGDGLVGFQIPPRTALILHRGRRVAAFGKGKLVARIPAHGDWPERRRMVPNLGTYRRGDALPHELDLLSWLRSARDRQGPRFPAEKTRKSVLASGTLVLSGGGKLGDETLKAFIDAAGGTSAAFVCIPSAARFDPGERVRSYSAKRLRAAGCTNVIVLHTTDPRQADGDPRWLRPLEKADAVWIDGGRTYRVMDVLEGTRARALMQALLDRGGVVGGSSAGCQVVGEMLVRGDPRTNQRLVYDGYMRGLDLLSGVVIDAHFRQRERTDPLRALIGKTPQLLGVGIDEDTALVVRKRTARVVGPNKVTFLTARADTVEATVLAGGRSFDLVTRRPKTP